MSKHTPGPWSTTPRFQDKVDVIHTKEANIPGRASLTVARVNVRDSWREEQEANAALIAAAPELLDALILVRMSAGWQYLHAESKAIINAAIGKATGEPA